MDARVQALRSSRPSGTDAVSRARQPSDKSLGYCQMSLRDKRSDTVMVTPVPLVRRQRAPLRASLQMRQSLSLS